MAALPTRAFKLTNRRRAALETYVDHDAEFFEAIALAVTLYQHDVERFDRVGASTPARRRQLAALVLHGEGLLAALDADRSDYHHLRSVLYPDLHEAIVLWNRLLEVSARPNHRPVDIPKYILGLNLVKACRNAGVDLKLIKPRVMRSGDACGQVLKTPFMGVLHLAHKWATHAARQPAPAEGSAYAFAAKSLKNFRGVSAK